MAEAEYSQSGDAPTLARKSYLQMLRSSAIVGGSSIIYMLIGLVRAKATALLLGPSGVGLMGALASIADLARTLAEAGINSSGVRQIAKSVGTGDTVRIARTVIVLRRTAVVLGLLGGVLLAAIAVPVSTLTFGSDHRAGAIALLGLAVFFRLVSDGRAVFLQGMRRIGDLARINVLGAVLGLAFCPSGFIVWLRESGVALAVVAVAAATLCTSWWYSRSVRIEHIAMNWSELSREVRPLLQLGLAFMTSALLTMGAAYVVRITLIRSHGLDGAGLYQAAWAIGGLYVNFVLQAMGTDFYPRLVAFANDNARCNQLVNEQAMVSLLLAATGVVGTLMLAPWVLTLLYSAEFAAATDMLRWFCLGMALRVVTWPLGYILVAKGRQGMFVAADVLWQIVNVCLTWLFVRWFGLAGAGIAFFASYVVHFFVVYPMCRRASGFSWSRTAAITTVVFAVVIGIVQAGFMLLELRNAMAVALLVVVLTAGVSMMGLRHMVAAQRVPGRLAWLIQKRCEKA